MRQLKTIHKRGPNMSPSTLQPLEPPRVSCAATTVMPPAPRSEAPSAESPRSDCAPLGASVVPGGVNFSIFSRTAEAVELLLFDGKDDAKPAQVIPLDPVANRTYHYWHTFVPGLRAGQLYAFRADGPYEPERGLLFRAKKVLLDPYGRGVAVPA